MVKRKKMKDNKKEYNKERLSKADLLHTHDRLITFSWYVKNIKGMMIENLKKIIKKEIAGELLT